MNVIDEPIETTMPYPENGRPWELRRTYIEVGGVPNEIRNYKVFAEVVYEPPSVFVDVSTHDVK